MIFYGKPVAEKIYLSLKKEISQNNLKPFLAVILVGEDAESLSYIRAKEKVAKEMGINFRLYQFVEIARQDEVVKLINDLNRNDYVHGIVVQLPLTPKMDTQTILGKINPDKDVDGFFGKYPTPAALAILEMLKFYKIDLKGKNIVLVGHGQLVGAPLEKLLIEQDLHPKICNRETPDIGLVTRDADIIVSATGSSGIIKPAMVKKEAIIIDAGTVEAEGRIIGDLNPEIYDKITSYSPVPGGVGPVTVACLMENLVAAAKKI